MCKDWKLILVQKSLARSNTHAHTRALTHTLLVSCQRPVLEINLRKIWDTDLWSCTRFHAGFESLVFYAVFLGGKFTTFLRILMSSSSVTRGHVQYKQISCVCKYIVSGEISFQITLSNFQRTRCSSFVWVHNFYFLLFMAYLYWYVPSIYFIYAFKAYCLRDAPTGLTFNTFTLCPHRIDVFCIYLRTYSDLCHLHHKLTGFYNRVEKCLLPSTDWGFKESSLRFVFKGPVLINIFLCFNVAY
jgi:hypothetical protein